MPRQNIIQLRKGTLAQWIDNNTQILASGEPGFETDTLRLKIGNGTTAWSGLNYVGLAGTGTSGYLPKFNSSQGVTNSLIFDNGTNVGIGTIDPAEKLTVDGNIRVADTAVTQGKVIQFSRGGGDQYDYTIGRYANALAISVANDPNTQRPFQVGYHSGATFLPKFHINGYTGDVGMGTVTPSHRLQLGTNTSASTATPETISLGGTYSSSAGGNAKLRLWTNGSNVMGLGVSADQLDYVCSAGYSHVFYNNGSERMRITPNGSVGIGTSSPHTSYKLNVEGGVLIGGSTIAGLYPSILGLASTIAVTGGGEGYGISFRYNVIGSGSSDVGNFIGYDGAGVSWTKGTAGTIHNAYTALFSAPTIATNNYALRTDGTTALCVTTGNVGIGTATPSEKLHVFGNINIDGSIRHTVNAVDGSNNIAPITWYNTMNDLNSVIAQIDVSTNTSPIEGMLVFHTHDGTTLQERVRITEVGNVGIGTTTPGYKLEVNGSFAASTKSFRIHHPSKKDHSLEYGSLESPYHGVRLTGRDKVIKGVGVVSLPDYLKDLIHDDDTLNIQITNIKHGKTIYIDKIDLKNGRFIVKADRAKSLGELQFFWTLSGVRKDVDHLVVEKRN